MRSSPPSDNRAAPSRGLFLCRVNRDDRNNAGVAKKCIGEVKALQRLGIHMDMVWLCDKGILCNEQLIFRFPFAVLSLPPVKYLFYLLFLHRIIRKRLDFGRYDFFFFRHELAHPAFIRTIQVARLASPAARLLLEIPTWPYRQEKKGFFLSLGHLLDRYYGRELKYYLDGIVHFGQVDRILGLPVIPMRNGIDLDMVPVSPSTPQLGILRLVAVGNWSFWHGLDRLLHGLAEYNEKEPKWEITLRIAGEGRASASLKQLVRRLNLEGQVRFYPALQGKDLDDLFADCDLGVGTLGMHRKGIWIDSSLKHREYAARGLPFLLAASDLDFPPHLPWVKYVPPADTPLDIEAIVAFYETLQGSNNLHCDIRAYAESQLSWERKFEKVL